jgi:glycine C-acetyltransferase
MGTFSKTFTVTGAFVAGSAPLVNYLRYFARSYMFSASLTPGTAAAVLGCLDIIEREPERLAALHSNVTLAADGLRDCGIHETPEAAIIPLLVPPGMDIRKAAKGFHRRGIFLNSVEYPAVPVSQQRFRISVMATHTPADIRRLVTAVHEIWEESPHNEGAPQLAFKSRAA